MDQFTIFSSATIQLVTINGSDATGESVTLPTISATGVTTQTNSFGEEVVYSELAGTQTNGSVVVKFWMSFAETLPQTKAPATTTQEISPTAAINADACLDQSRHKQVTLEAALSVALAAIFILVSAIFWSIYQRKKRTRIPNYNARPLYQAQRPLDTSELPATAFEGRLKKKSILEKLHRRQKSDLFGQRAEMPGGIPESAKLETEQANAEAKAELSGKISQLPESKADLGELRHDELVDLIDRGM